MQNLIQSIKDSKLTPNQLYLLWCLQYEEIPLNINVHTEIRALKNSTHLDAKGKITPLGLEAVSSLPKPSSKAIKTIVLLDDMIEKYLSLFPKGKLPSGKQARADKKNLKQCFTWFFKTYGYDWETVLKATAMYVNEYELKGYLYMRTSQYFITKANPDRTRDSELANYCSLIVTGDTTEDPNHFSEKVV